MKRTFPLRPALLLPLALALACERGRRGDDPVVEAEVCDAPSSPPRQLRLLTRREYNRTVEDLFGGGSGASCDDDADCDIATESCSGGACLADPCTLHTFVFDPNGASVGRVHVAGTFNGWPGTEAAGGWPMEYIAELGLWVTKRALDEGQHQYKFVVDESTWVHDTANGVTVDDGYGGYNSVLNLECGDAEQLAAEFPSETRPKGFGYDNHAASAIVSATHVEMYLRAAETLSERALRDLPSILACDPDELGETACLTTLIEDFGRRAWRRPLTAAQVERLLTRALAEDSFEDGVAVVIQALLTSPYFLYRSELGQGAAGGVYVLTDHEIAAALSYTLWGTTPDEALLAAADAGELRTAEQRDAAARRLLADPRARAHLQDFAVMWLEIESNETASKASWVEDDFPALREDMEAEVRAFFEHVVFDGAGTVDSLLTSRTTYVDADLAELYGLTGVSGQSLEEVTLPDGQRGGVLGLGAVLAATSHSDSSSPILRGLFVRERLLCQPLGTPPADVPAIPEIASDATTRERFEQHTSDPVCASCHQYIDPVGFGFEAYDAVGRYREEEGGKAVDASGDMVDVELMGAGTHAPFFTLGELGGILAESDAAQVCFTRNVWRFTMGFEEESGDLCAIEALTAESADVQDLLIQLITSPEFVQREQR